MFNIGSLSASDLRINFTVDQFLQLDFKPGVGFLHVSAMGSPVVNVTGGPKAGLAIAIAKSEIQNQAESQLAGPLAAAQAQLRAIAASRLAQCARAGLKSLDTGADAHFVDAIFRPDGVVLCGPVSLTYRHRPHVSFERTPAGDGFDAIESWIPGGRIDRFEWTWRWFTQPNRRAAGTVGWGDGGAHFHPAPPAAAARQVRTLHCEREAVTGPRRSWEAVPRDQRHARRILQRALVPVRSEFDCQQFRLEFKLPDEVGPLVRLWDPILV